MFGSHRLQGSLKVARQIDADANAQDWTPWQRSKIQRRKIRPRELPGDSVHRLCKLNIEGGDDARNHGKNYFTSLVEIVAIPGLVDSFFRQPSATGHEAEA